MRTGITLIAMAMFLMAGQVCGTTISDKISKDGKTADQMVAQAQKLAYYAHYDSALVLLHHALLVYEKMRLGNDNTQIRESIIRCNLLLGCNYVEKSDVANSKLFLNKGIDSCEIWLGKEHKLIAEGCEYLASLYETIGDIESMRVYAERGYVLCQKLYQETDIEQARSVFTLGRTELHTGNLSRAEPLLRQALANSSVLSPQYELDLAKLYFNMGMICFQKSDIDTYMKYMQRALAISLKLVGERHTFSANCYFKIGNFYFLNSDFTTALKFYQKSHNILTTLFGENHYLTIATFTNLALTCSATGRYLEAIEFHQKAGLAAKNLYGENSWYGGSCMYLGEVYEKIKDYQKALALYLKALEIIKKLEFPIIGMPQLQYNRIARVNCHGSVENRLLGS